jgi:hypothetical protein
MVRIAWLVGSVGLTVVSYLVFLGWNERKALEHEEPGLPGIECTGPHEPAELLLLGGVLAVIVVVGAWFRHEYLVPTATVVTVAAVWAVDAITVDDPCVDGIGLLPVGVLFLLIGSTIAAVVLVLLTVSVRDRRVGP